MSIAQGIAESIFDVVYLTTVIALGIILIRAAKGRNECLLYGIMAVTLGFGDAFHLIPRSYALLTTGVDDHAKALGIGKFITSITMTIFYIILYHIWNLRYKKENMLWLTICMYILGVARIGLCLPSQNQWTSVNPPVSWGIYRNIPFSMIGIIVIVCFFIEAKKNADNNFKYMWLAITLSFAFYIPVVLWSNKWKPIGSLMIPKTMAYVWVVYMGYEEYTSASDEEI